MAYKFFDRQLAVPSGLNVLIPMICHAIAEGRPHILLAGADHSWHKDLVPNERLAVVRQGHFYDSTDDVIATPIANGVGGYFSVGEILGRWGKIFDDYVRLQGYAEARGVTIFNVGSYSFIDAFARESINRFCCISDVGSQQSTCQCERGNSK
jgi:hypothetical protein